MKRPPIQVTKTRLPDKEVFSRYCDDIFERGWLTNNGQCLQELELELARYLDVKHLLVCNNGTQGLMLAAHCAGLAGKKVALTPYSYVATLSSLLWLNCTPVFVDIDPETLCLCPKLLREAFRKEPDIAGVMPVHIYGAACDVHALRDVCREFGASLIYDAAHAFGSRYQGKSLLDYGDYSVCSFHATKLFHTVEGGCLVAHGAKECKDLALARAFGHIHDTHISLGINGKMCELHAAMGLCLLPGIDEEIANRKKLINLYDEGLTDPAIFHPVIRNRPEWNYAYYPILLPDNQSRKRVEKALAARDIHARRYFYPSLNTLPYLKKDWQTHCPVSENAAERVLCLPLYGDLEEDVVEEVCGIVRVAL